MAKILENPNLSKQEEHLTKGIRLTKKEKANLPYIYQAKMEEGVTGIHHIHPTIILDPRKGDILTLAHELGHHFLGHKGTPENVALDVDHEIAAWVWAHRRTGKPSILGENLIGILLRVEEDHPKSNILTIYNLARKSLKKHKAPKMWLKELEQLGGEVE